MYYASWLMPHGHVATHVQFPVIKMTHVRAPLIKGNKFDNNVSETINTCRSNFLWLIMSIDPIMSVYLTILFTVPIVIAVSSMATPVHVPSNNWKWKYCKYSIICTCINGDNMYKVVVNDVLGNKTSTLLNFNYLFLKPYPMIVGKDSIFYFSYTKG